jgi:hypothetical protein
MQKYLLKSALAITCLTLVSIPMSAQSGKSGGGSTGASACAIAYTPRLSTTTTTTETNSAVGVFGKVTNCASGKKRYIVTGSSVSSCGVETVFASGVMSFGGGESKNISVAYPIAPDTCRGPMTVSISVYDGGTLLAIGSTPLTIQ